MKKIIFLTSGLSPYRKELYDYLYTFFKNKNIEFKVLCELEKNNNWRYQDFKEDYTLLLRGKNIQYKNIDFPFNFGINKILEKEKPDFIIIAGSWSTPTNYLFNLKKYKVIFWSESNLFGIKRTNKIEEKIWNYFRTKFYRSINYFLIPGERAKEAVLKWRDSKKNPIFINFPNTIEEIPYQKIQKEDFTKREKIFLIPARLVKVKGIEEFIENIKDLIKNKNLKILIAGEGNLKNKIEGKIKEYNLRNKIILLGYMDSKKLKEYYAIADYFILPSLYDPSPLAAIEALYYELPIIISDQLGNMPEVLDKNGVTFNPFNKKDIEKKMEEILNWSEAEYKEAKHKSKEIYNKKFKKDKIVENLYQNLLEIEGKMK